MKFGVLQFFSWPERRVPIDTVFARALQRIDVMEQTGYDAVWLAEHHFTGYSVCPSVHMVGAHVAARTSRLRIGTAVSLAALYHPLRLAEEVALLDVLSGGRVNWGAGRGFDPREFHAFDVDPAQSRERFFENVQIVLAAWTNERVTFEGRFNSVDGVELLPKPVQQPHPPVWLAATSPDAVRLAASNGFSILMDPHATHEEIGQKRALHAEVLAEHGHDPAGRDTPVARLLALADTDAEAREVAAAGAQWTVGSYARPIAGGDDPVARYVDRVIVHGTPDRVTDQLHELGETIGLDYLLCSPLSHRSFTLFTEKVLPRFL